MIRQACGRLTLRLSLVSRRGFAVSRAFSQTADAPSPAFADVNNAASQNQPILAKGVSGTVKWFHNGKGYGFITRGDNNQDVFVHFRNIAARNPAHPRPSLLDGESVQFDVIQGQKGDEAVAITGPNGIAVQGSPFAANSFAPRGSFNPRGGFAGPNQGFGGGGRNFSGDGFGGGGFDDTYQAPQRRRNAFGTGDNSYFNDDAPRQRQQGFGSNQGYQGGGGGGSFGSQRGGGGRSRGRGFAENDDDF